MEVVKQIIDFIDSTLFKTILVLGGYFWAFLVTTKMGNNIRSFFKNFIYKFRNPPIIYSASFIFEFKDAEYTSITALMNKVFYNNSISKYKLQQNGLKDSCCNFHYPGLDYVLEVEQCEEFISLSINIKETESNYKNLTGHIKNMIIKGFIEDIVLSEISKEYTTEQYEANYQFNLKFTEQKYNFFLKERFTNISKGYVSNALVTIKDENDDNFVLTADLKGISICVKNNFSRFIELMGKYSSIV